MITKRVTTLADGRELIYFDDEGSALPAERAIDERHLDPRPPTATMRQDVLTGDWISVAAARQNRAFLPDQDPLAPATPDSPSEVPSLYDVAVFENRSPSFGPELAEPGQTLDLDGIGFGRTAPSIGRCEVVCFDPGTTGSLGDLPVNRMRTVIEAWADRTAALSALPGVAQVFPFENRGQAIGVTLQHPHGQIYSYPYVTPRTKQLLASIAEVPDLFARILETEQASERVVLAGEHWTAFVPFAARWPIEVHLMPHRHVPDLAATDDAEREELATVYRTLLRAIDRIYPEGDPATHFGNLTPYISAWHQAPVHVGRDDIRLTMQLTSPRRAADRLKYMAGSEAAMGAWIADMTPERVADMFRDGIGRA